MAFQTWFLDEGTRRLTRNLVTKEAVAGNIVNENYTYDPAGNVKQVADGTVDIQCFNYDYRGQMVEAFTIASGACPATPSTTTLGTAASNYWSSFTYSSIGNRLTRTDRVKSGTTVTSTVYTHTYPASGPSVAPNGATGVGGPHAVSQVSRKIGTGTPTLYAYKYDAVGNMTTRAAFANTYNTEGRLAATKNGTAAAASYVYDADGNRLLRRNPDTTTTLYVGDTEITLGTSTTTPKTSQRWYQFGGKTIATRTSAGMTMLAADHHGTSLTQMDSASASYVTRRFTPFGGARNGGVTSGTTSATWRGDHGFLDKPVDATSGLTQVGARYYDNGIGTFISVDPLLDVNDPHQANAYNYSRNNPITYSDPTGLMCADGCGAGGSSSRSYDSFAGVSEGAPRGLGTETPNVSSPGSTAPVVQAKPSGLKKKIAMATVGGLVDFKVTFTQSLMRDAGFGLRRELASARMKSILARARSGSMHLSPTTGATARADFRLLQASKYASRGLGVIGAGVSFAMAKADGDGNTEAALKTGISVAGSVAGGAVGTAVCGGLPICTAAGAAIGGIAAGWVADKYEGKIESWAAEIDDTTSLIANSASEGWEQTKSFASGVGDTVSGWFD